MGEIPVLGRVAPPPEAEDTFSSFGISRMKETIRTRHLLPLCGLCVRTSH
jgi:hypothetical protein